MKTSNRFTLAVGLSVLIMGTSALAIPQDDSYKNIYFYIANTSTQSFSTHVISGSGNWSNPFPSEITAPGTHDTFVGIPQGGMFGPEVDVVLYTQTGEHACEF